MKIFNNCAFSTPSFKKFYISDYSFFGGYNLNSVGEIISFRSPPHFYEFEIKSQSFDEVFSNVSYLQTLIFTVIKLDSTKRNSLRNLRDNRFFIVFEDKNGLFWLIGERSLTISNQNSNINDTDNNYLLTLRSNNKNPFRQIEPAFASTLSPFIPFPCPLSSSLILPYYSEPFSNYFTCFI